MQALENQMKAMGMEAQEWQLVDCLAETEKLLSKLIKLHDSDKCLYLDFEGVDLCRKGTIAIGQLTYPAAAGADSKSPIYLLDFIALPDILEIKIDGNISLRNILEGDSYMKFIFDPRCDSDCIYHTKGKVHMKNVICLQLCEVAKDRAQGDERRFVNGLKRVLETYTPSHLRAAVSGVKQKGINLFAPERGGSYEVFTIRPLSADIIAYCLIDIAFFELLESKLFEPLSQRSKAWVRAQSEIRVNDCLGPRSAHEGGRERAIAPRGP